MSSQENFFYNPDAEIFSKTDAPRVAGVEFGSLPESIDNKEIFAGTVTALLDLRQFIEDEVEYNPDLTPEIKKKIEIAGTAVYTFFTTLIGIDPISQKPTEFNARALKTTLDQVPEEVFQAWYYLCRTVPQAQECLCADPKVRSTSGAFPEQYGLPYVMVQRALRTLTASDPAILQKNPAAERVYSLLDAKNRAAQSTIDRSKPFPVKPEDITPDRIRWASVNLEELLEERREHLPAEVQADVTLVASFFRVSIEPAIAKDRLDAKNLPPEERRYYENVNTYIADPDRLNMTVIPSNIIEAVARLSLADHTIHLALLGHNIRNVGQVLDASGNRVSSLDRPFAYHPVTVAAHHTIERDKLGLATIHELYRLDDVLSTGNHSGAVEVVSATQYAKLADQMGNAVPRELGFFGKTWKLLTTPIGELRERRRNLVRERRDNAQILIWTQQIIGTDPETLGKVPRFQSGPKSPLHTILTSLEQEPHLQTRPIMEALRTLVEWAATSTSPEYGRRVRNVLGGERVPGTIILERIVGIIGDIKNITKHLEFFRIFKKDKTPNEDVVIDERGWPRLLSCMKEMLEHPEFIVDTVASECYTTVLSFSDHVPDFPKSNKTLDKIAVHIKNSNPVETVQRLCQFIPFGIHVGELKPKSSVEGGKYFYRKFSGPIGDIQAILKDFSTVFHTAEVLQDVKFSLIDYATIHGGKDFGIELAKKLETEKELDAKTLLRYVEFAKVNVGWIEGLAKLPQQPDTMYDPNWDILYSLVEDMDAQTMQLAETTVDRLEGKVCDWSDEFISDGAGQYYSRESKKVSTPADRIRFAVEFVKETQHLATENAQKIVAYIKSLKDQTIKNNSAYSQFAKVPPVDPSAREPHLPELDMTFLKKCFDSDNVISSKFVSRSEESRRIVLPDVYSNLMMEIKTLIEEEKKYTGKSEVRLETGMERCVEEEWKLYSLAERIVAFANSRKLLGLSTQKHLDDLIAEFAYRDSPRTIHAKADYPYDSDRILIPYHDRAFVPALQALNPNQRLRLFELIEEIYEKYERELDRD